MYCWAALHKWTVVLLKTSYVRSGPVLANDHLCLMNKQWANDRVFVIVVVFLPGEEVCAVEFVRAGIGAAFAVVVHAARAPVDGGRVVDVVADARVVRPAGKTPPFLAGFPSRSW